MANWDIDRSGPIHRFVEGKLQERIDEALLKVPEGEKGVVLVAANEDEVKLVVVGDFGHGLSVIGCLEHAYGGTLDAEVAIRKVF